MADNDALASYAALVEILEHLPILVRETRRRRGLSVHAAAHIAGVTGSTVSRFERGQGAHWDSVIGLLRFVGDVPAAVQEPRGATNTPGSD